MAASFVAMAVLAHLAGASMRLKDRIRAFAEKYGLTHEQLAEMITTPYGTFQKWMRSDEGSVKPPACMLTLMEILEESSEARRIVGINEAKRSEK